MNDVRAFIIRKALGPLVLALSAFAFLYPSPLTAQVMKWEERFPETVPVGRDDHMMTFDSDRGCVVMWGGDNADDLIWQWDGTNWTSVDAETKPALKREAALAYDSVRKVTVLFGGYDFVLGDVVNVTWEFDGTEWECMTPPNSPIARKNHAMAFDAEHGLMIMFGGDVEDYYTWAYDGGDWRVIADENNSPGLRGAHGMVYDSDRKKIVLFGGSYGSTYFNDTWEWDGSIWRDVTPESEEDSPPPMRAFAMVYDSLRKKTVLFGGRDDSGLDGFDRTWEWDGSVWREVDALSQPSMRHECAAAYDSSRNRTVLFGGSSGETLENRYKDDTWWYPNNPPVFNHQPLLGAYPDRDVVITTGLVDYDGDEIEAALFYRDTGETVYNSMPLTRTGDDTFSATIPVGAFSADGFEYYLQAGDPYGSGLTVREGGSDLPFPVSVGTVGSIRIHIKPKEARLLGALWRPAGTTEWLESGDVVKDLEPGDLEIQFNSIEKYNKPHDFIVYVVNGKRTNYEAEYVPK
jgi:hypothetical protein